jgi:hypothetical protein
VRCVKGLEAVPYGLWEGRGAPRAHIDEDRKVLAGRHEDAFLGVEHPKKVMNALFVEVEELTGDPERVALAKLALIGEVVFECKHRALTAARGLFPQPEVFQQAIRRPVEGHMVVGNVQMAVVIRPLAHHPFFEKIHGSYDSSGNHDPKPANFRAASPGSGGSVPRFDFLCCSSMLLHPKEFDIVALSKDKQSAVRAIQHLESFGLSDS